MDITNAQQLMEIVQLDISVNANGIRRIEVLLHSQAVGYVDGDAVIEAVKTLAPYASDFMNAIPHVTFHWDCESFDGEEFEWIDRISLSIPKEEKQGWRSEGDMSSLSDLLDEVTR